MKKWRLKLIVAKNEMALREGMSPEKGRFECCNVLKTEALKQAIERYGFEALFLAIRRDEHIIRAKERFWSPRDEDFKWNYQEQPLEMWDEFYPVRDTTFNNCESIISNGVYKSKEEEKIHYRIHPMLAWREIDIWRYIKRERLLVIGLYFARGGKRYRSVGCECCCEPVESNANTSKKREMGNFLGLSDETQL